MEYVHKCDLRFLGMSLPSKTTMKKGLKFSLKYIIMVNNGTECGR